MYRVPATTGTAEITVKRSRFIATAVPAADRDAALAAVDESRCQHPEARHHCWAWQGRNSAASSDDGEPGGTAGRPILGVIGHKGLVDVVVVVTRYFGGTKLGAGGLVRAYAGAAEAVLSELPGRTEEPVVHCSLAMAFADEQPLRHWLSGQPDADLRAIDYGEGVTATLTVPEAVLADFEAWCAARGLCCHYAD
ncbi:IMPACT family protein [Spiribacter vilamensis]|uniref:Putative YigZ family protein n=1 Tax=Spiribacter vilamensis TaxID=531306 RepID=A0A4Q8CZ80_9GAMM|nr:YigZ family protein [Spiribacter vilamensis]RZU98274.1 putative YigZ family protein [Spiribacter vilamensis]TVO60832.1 DUF1949 domain-containing protein [Spiribacter vilamensis]